MESKRDPITDITVQEQKPTVFEKWMLDTFPSVQSYCNQKMQGRSSDSSSSSSGQTSGFYSSENIFKKDFDTFASHPRRVKRFAASLAYQIFCARETQIAEGAIGESDTYNVLECGGGDGKLCKHILEIIEAMAKEDKRWKALLDTLHYHLVELSTGLVAAQKECNKKYIENNKVTVTEGNALDLSNTLKDIKIAFALSNELIDMFQPHVVSKKQDGSVRLHQTLPFISAEELKKHVKAEEFIAIEKKSKLYKSMLENGLHGTRQPTTLRDALESPDKILISEAELQKWHHFPMTYVEVVFVRATVVPSVRAFLQRHPAFVKAMKTGQCLIEDGMLPYLDGVKSKLIHGGVVASVDYGEDAYTRLVEQNRTYKNKVEGSDIYEPDVDITHNKNFTIYAEEGKGIGLNVFHYGTQQTMSVAVFPKHILSDEDKATFDRIANEEPFNAIFLVYGEIKKMLDGLHPFTAASMPVTYAELDALPPIYTVESGIKLHRHDIQFLTLYKEFLERKVMFLISHPSKSPEETSKEEGVTYATLKDRISIFSKMLEQEPLEKDEMESVKQFFGSRLKTYPIVNDRKQRCKSSAIQSPVTASGDAHDRLVRIITNYVGNNESEFRLFLKAMNDKEYSRALRIISTAHSDLAYEVTMLYLSEVKKIPKFNINEAAGDKKHSALHIAATRNNKRVYDLLVENGADVTLKDAAGNVAGFYLKPLFVPKVVHS